MKSEVVFSDTPLNWPQLKEQLKAKSGLTDDCVPVLFFDRQLAKSKDFQKFKSSFAHSFSLQAGEKLKSLAQFELLAKKTLEATRGIGRDRLVFVSAGGGSVGDCIGFLASVFKRGVAWVQVPTTLLAAVDSAHGGKTALNLGGYKNQIGSFYFPKTVVIQHPFLKSLPSSVVQSSAGEFYKTALLAGGTLWDRLETIQKPTVSDLIPLLPQGVEYKNQVVAQDPQEEKGLRFVLNFGHSVGHVLEAKNDFHHGLAVAMGCRFAMHWSQHKGFLPAADYERALVVWTRWWDETQWARLREQLKKKKMTWAKWKAALALDKKMEANDRLRFVFLQGIGQPFVQQVTLDELKQELNRQGLL